MIVGPDQRIAAEAQDHFGEAALHLLHQEAVELRLRGVRLHALLHLARRDGGGLAVGEAQRHAAGFGLVRDIRRAGSSEPPARRPRRPRRRCAWHRARPSTWPSARQGAKRSAARRSSKPETRPASSASSASADGSASRGTGCGGGRSRQSAIASAQDLGMAKGRHAGRRQQRQRLLRRRRQRHGERLGRSGEAQQRLDGELGIELRRGADDEDRRVVGRRRPAAARSCPPRSRAWRRPG